MSATRHVLAAALLLAMLGMADPAHAESAAEAARATGAGWMAPACAVAIGATGLGAALAQGRAVANAMEGLARNPGAAGAIRGAMILGLAMIESVVVLVTVFLITRA
jgi:F-type H+-transporting ATPase subunit c